MLMKNREQHSETKCVAVLGTDGDVGKSVVVAAPCRIFNDLGMSVAPVKAQNMSNKSSVTPAGGEMGRAQMNINNLFTIVGFEKKEMCNAAL